MPVPDPDQKIIDIKKRRLQKLKEQQAAFGLHTPPHISVEIDTIAAELAALGVDAGETEPPAAPAPSPAPAGRGQPEAGPEPAAEISRYYALLVGVRDYAAASYRSLPHTIPDVIELDKLLRAAGYTTRLLHSDLPDNPPTFGNIWGELENLAQQTGPGDLLLVYFGGHGDLDADRRAYLVPADLRSRAALPRTGIDLAEFTATLGQAGAQARLLILDACHSGIGRSGGAMPPEFERLAFLQAAGSATLAACRRGEVAYDHDQSEHGAFTYYLLQGLRGAAKNAHELVTFSALSSYVTAGVKQWALERSLQQWPNAETKLVGDPPLLRLATSAGSRDGAGSRPPNPFTETLAINRPQAFIGRTAELNRLTAMLRSGSVSLTGDPKIGKSSLLLALARDWSGPVLGPIDCHSLEDRDDFYETLADLLKLAGANWRRDLRPALRQTEALLLLDEFDTAAGIGLTAQDVGRFRALCSRNRGLHLLTAGRQPLREVFPDAGRGSPVYNFLPPLSLEPLTEAEARRLLAHPWAATGPAFAPAVQAELISLTGRHPFKLQRAAFHFYEALHDPRYDWQAAYRQDLEHLL